MPASPSPRWALLALLALAAALYGWNAWAQPGFWGYDEGGHAGYALSILESGRLPHPLSGWSSFHPPLYYLLAAATWRGVEPLAPGEVLFALRMLSGLAILTLAYVVHRLALRATRSGPIALTACALTLFVPVAQLSATMLGNEALTAAFTALALAPILALQRDPGSLRDGALAGLFAGLAFATKYSGGWVVATCAVPFLRRDLDSRALRSLLLCAGAIAVVAGPVYLRNAMEVGTPLPFTRTLEPMKSGEQRLYVRPRQLGDYLAMPLDCGRYPYAVITAPGGAWVGANPAMLRLPCITYAGFWFDPFGLRATRRDPAEGLLWGFLLLWAGLIPTLCVLLGLGRAAPLALRSRGRAPETPLLVLTALGLLSYAGFTWLAPSLAAAKSSYLLPLLAPAGLFFAAGAAALPRIPRRIALGSSLLAALLAAFVFTTGAVFPPTNAAAARGYWASLGRQLPDSYIVEATLRLIPAPPAAQPEATAGPDRPASETPDRARR